MTSRLIVFTLAAAALAAQMLPAQAQSCTVSTMVTVLDRKSNQPIDGLTANDFHARFHGHEMPISSVRSAPQERRLLFVLDRSGSMNHQKEGFRSFDARRLVIQILEDALPAIPSTDGVAFLAFSGDLSTQVGFADPGSPVEKAREVLDWTPAGKGNKRRTALWDNIDSALRMLESPRQGDVIIVVSDGGDNQSRLQQEDVRKELLKAGVPVVAIALADPFADTPEEQAGMVYLLDLAKVTGGAALVVGGPASRPDPDIMIGLLPSDSAGMPGTALLRPTSRLDPEVALGVYPHELVRELSHQYAIEFAMPVTQKPEKWQLEVTISGARKGMRVLYPRQVSCIN